MRLKKLSNRYLDSSARVWRNTSNLHFPKLKVLLRIENEWNSYFYINFHFINQPIEILEDIFLTYFRKECKSKKKDYGIGITFHVSRLYKTMSCSLLQHDGNSPLNKISVLRGILPRSSMKVTPEKSDILYWVSPSVICVSVWG